MIAFTDFYNGFDSCVNTISELGPTEIRVHLKHLFANQREFGATENYLFTILIAFQFVDQKEQIKHFLLTFVAFLLC